MTISGDLQGLVIYYKTPNIKRYAFSSTSLYNLAEISAHHLQLKCMGSHFFPGAKTILFDNIYSPHFLGICAFHRAYFITLECTYNT